MSTSPRRSYKRYYREYYSKCREHILVGIKKRRNTVLTTVNRIEQLKQIAYSKLGKILPVTKIFKILLVLTAFVVVSGFFATSISLSSKVLFRDQAVVNSLKLPDDSFKKQ